MRIGMTFGCYCPMHQGHLDVIMKSKKENDLTYVFVCHNHLDERDTNYGFTLDKKYNIIRNFLKSELIKVEKQDDDELGLDLSYSDDNWVKWLNSAILKIDELDPLDTLTIYCGEDSYKQSIERVKDKLMHSLDVIVLNRKSSSISATKCRENPIKYWKYICQPYRAYFSHNVLITGTASEGKTTLCEDIGKYFNIPYSYEKGRDICKLKNDNEMNVKDFIYNIYEQHKYNEELICSPQNPGVMISDTDNLVTLMYAYFYSKRSNFSLSKDDYIFLENLVWKYRPTTKWDKIFLLTPKNKPIVDDGERYLGNSDFEIRYEFYKYLKNLLHQFNYSFEELNGNYFENFRTVKNYINNYFGD